MSLMITKKCVKASTYSKTRYVGICQDLFIGHQNKIPNKQASSPSAYFFFLHLCSFIVTLITQYISVNITRKNWMLIFLRNDSMSAVCQLLAGKKM